MYIKQIYLWLSEWFFFETLMKIVKIIKDDVKTIKEDFRKDTDEIRAHINLPRTSSLN